ncbi:MAG: hypothetical protein QOJ98_2607, partial [Acidobacteriota bacterium]|nr:hypothetical protein [Acidobacteriota bacterium]
MGKPSIDPFAQRATQLSCAEAAPPSAGDESTYMPGDVTDAVLAGMRRIATLRTATGPQRAQLIEECRRTLGASSVAVCRVQDGELVIIHLAGSSPDAEAIEEIIACASKRSRQPFSILRRRESSDLALAGRAPDIVSAILPSGVAPWVEHVVASVAERLVLATIKPLQSSGRAGSAGGTLVLPADMVIGASAAMRDLLQQMSATVSSGIDVLLSGETGTGKEFLARIVHDSGPTRHGPFVPINCAAIPGELLEAE